MALKSTILYKGIEMKDVYVRVNQFSGTKSKLTFVLGIYGPEQDVLDGEGQVVKKERSMLFTENHSCAYDLSGGNALIQAYTFVKTLPEYVASVNC
jgi:hypothetical protein